MLPYFIIFLFCINFSVSAKHFRAISSHFFNCPDCWQTIWFKCQYLSVYFLMWLWLCCTRRLSTKPFLLFCCLRKLFFFFLESLLHKTWASCLVSIFVCMYLCFAVVLICFCIFSIHFPIWLLQIPMPFLVAVVHCIYFSAASASLCLPRLFIKMLLWFVCLIKWLLNFLCILSMFSYCDGHDFLLSLVLSIFHLSSIIFFWFFFCGHAAQVSLLLHCIYQPLRLAS